MSEGSIEQLCAVRTEQLSSLLRGADTRIAGDITYAFLKDALQHLMNNRAFATLSLTASEQPGQRKTSDAADVPLVKQLSRKSSKKYKHLKDWADDDDDDDDDDSDEDDDDEDEILKGEI